MAEQMKREIAAMKTVSSHPNIVELHEVMATRSKIYLALELVRGGELFSRVARRRGVRDEEAAARRYFRQLVAAVGFCHARGVFHRDLKLENLLLDDEAGSNLKVADFGLSALAGHARAAADGLLHTACGTPAYVAPEVLAGKGYDGAKADLWCFGVILYVLLVGRLPFSHEENLMVMYRKMRRGEFLCPRWVSADARSLIAGLLDPNPTTRITVARLVETPWYQKQPLPVLPPPPGPSADDDKEKEEPDEVLNAFHLISLSEGFDQSPLFDQGRGRGVRSATREAASSVVSRLESLVTGRGGGGSRGVCLEAAEMFSVAPSVLLVDVKKDGGETTLP